VLILDRALPHNLLEITAVFLSPGFTQLLAVPVQGNIHVFSTTLNPRSPLALNPGHSDEPSSSFSSQEWSSLSVYYGRTHKDCCTAKNWFAEELHATSRIFKVTKD